MTDVTPQRAIASRILKCGINRVWVDQDALSDISLALTRDDVKKLISDGTIRKKQPKGISRGRAREKHEQIKRGQRRGHGRRKGAKFSKVKRKDLWINRIRPQRKFIKTLRDKGMLDKHDYRKVYKQAKGGQFRSVNYLKNQLQEANLIKAPSATKTARRR